MTTTITSQHPTAQPTTDPTTELPIEQLESDIWKGAANLTAAEHDWLRRVAEFDRRRGWERWEAHSCAHWLCWQVGLDLRAAREKVRVAHALERFPRIADAMADGTLSYSKVRAITRIATPATEQALVELALAGTTNQVERMVSAKRRADPPDDEQDAAQWAQRGLWHRVQPDGTVRITLVLSPDDAATFLSAAEQYAPPAEPLDDGTFEPRAARRADGAVCMADAAHAAMAQTLSAPRYLVTVHADLDALVPTAGRTEPTRTPQGASHDVTSTDHDDGAVDHETGRCEIEADGDACDLPIGISRATALRLLCDADVQALVHNAELVGVTDKSSVVTGKLRRLVLARDRCCQYPGCGRRAGVHVHHIHERLHHGNNELDNLTVLCHFHHRRVHEGGWGLHRDSNGHLVFTSPTGQVVTQAPPAVIGDAGAVRAKGRSADDGRSQWAGDRLHLDLALQALADLERLGGSW